MNIKKLDLNLLQALDILLEERSVSRAARRLNLTQPTVSNMLARLRELFDDPLFSRTRHGLIPTNRALALEPELKQILASVASLVAPQTFDPQTCDATITLSSNDYMQFVLIAPALIVMAEKAPNMRFAVLQAAIADLVEMMDRGRIDIAVTIPEFSDNRLRDQHLYTEQYVVIRRKEHPIKTKRISMANFLKYPHAIVSPTAGHFYGPTDEALAKQGMQRTVGISVSSFFALIEVVEHSDYLALIPRRLYAKYASRLSMAEPPIPVAGFEAIAVWHTKTHTDPARQWVTKQLAEMAMETNAV